jgi:hypothetical protein
MALDAQNWRPITFQGVVFPPTLMGISILEPVLGIRDRDLIDWVWGLDTCRGTTKSAPADWCLRCAQQTVDLLLENRQRVIDGIKDRLGSHGFDPEGTYRDWILAFQRIVELSAAADEECFWSAPSHSNDLSPDDAKDVVDALERERKRLNKSENSSSD